MDGSQMLRRAPLVALALLWIANAARAAARAAAPWSDLLTMQHVDADPKAEYRLREDDGPWLIVACSFSGEGAEKQAKELALELRKRYKLKAYVHVNRFDYQDDLESVSQRAMGRKVKVKHRRATEFDEYAVMVGNFAAVDDPAAQATLEKLKYAQPECLTNKTNSSENLVTWRAGAQKYVQDLFGKKDRPRGPMGQAFVTTNPLLPKDYFTPQGVDPFVVRLNKDVEYSLLTCKGRYTVQVARFNGDDEITQKKVQDLKNEPLTSDNSKLAEAAVKAEVLVRVLRMKGYEAYVLHDRYASIVTVGSFDSVGTPRPDGRTEINPKVHEIMTTFGADFEKTNGVPTGGMKAKKVGPYEGVGEIVFDIQPMPVEVPRQTISANLSSNMLGQR